MTQRVSVGMSYSDTGFVVGVIIAVLGFGAALIAAALEAHPVALGILTAIGGIGFLLAFVRHLTISKNQRWITPTDTGFLLVDRRGEFEFTDEMVSDLATWAKLVYSNGHPSKNRRTGSFVITAGESSVTFQFAYNFPLNQPDPLGVMLDRVFKKLVTAAKDNLQRGGRVIGEGWYLDRSGLSFAAGKEDVSLPLGEITHIDMTDGRICLWRRGEGEAVLRVKASSPNALVMARVLQEILPKDRPEEDPANGLGRIIFERDQSIRGGNLVAGVSLIAVGFMVGLGLVVFGIMEQNFLGFVGLAIMGGCVAGVVTLWNRRVNLFRCHAFGVAHTTPRGVTKLAYGSIGRFTYSGIRQYVNGSYTGTTVTMNFEPLEETDAEPIRYSATFQNADDELDNLRDFISRVIASHMLRRLQSGQTVLWTGRMRFLPDGLELTKSGWFGKGESIHLPYNMIGQYDLTNGVFRISARDQAKWLIDEPVSQPNFFPGFVLLMMILHPPVETDESHSAPADAPA